MPNIPTVTVQAASGVGATGATLNGTITLADSGGNATIEGFNWGLTTDYGSVASATGSFVAAAFSQPLTGLLPNTTYHYQAFATGPTGTGVSADATFTTPIAPTVTVQPASGVGSTGATLNGTITVADSGGNATIEGFNWGLTSAYENVASAAGSFAEGAFSQALTGLAANTTYHYQAFATGPTGTGVSTDATFATPYKTNKESGSDLFEVRMPGSDLYEVRV